MAMVILPAKSAFAATYTVLSGDSLYSIGKLFSLSASVLQSSNSLSSSVIYPGQSLKVSCQVYTVKSGDTLYLISKSKGVSLTDLRKANNKYDDKIIPGQILNIPGSFVSAAAGVIPYTQSDVDLLARLITAEAGSEPYNAKVSVGAVVVNRVKNPLYPNTISGVIYEKSGGYYQFTPVMNGYINKPATSDSIKAAYDALKGIDPTKGALYFFDNSVTNQWLLSKPVSIRIDKMIFSY
ncbi:MAG: cell wall hydrolase [Clostridiaceae bacterium]